MTFHLEFENPTTEDLVTIQVDAVKHVFAQAVSGCRESDTAPDPEEYEVRLVGAVECIGEDSFIGRPDWVTDEMIINEIETNYIDEL